MFETQSQTTVSRWFGNNAKSLNNDLLCYCVYICVKFVDGLDKWCFKAENLSNVKAVVECERHLLSS